MIQRIQTVYLLFALILLGLIAWLPLGEVAVGDHIYQFTIKGITSDQTHALVYNGLPLIILMSIIILLQIIVIFGFKNRIRQMRLATFNLLLMLGVLGVCWYFVHSAVKILGEGVYQFKLPVSFPLIGAILNYLAIRAIGKDEALVRSVDRIR